jgi:exoribonuclease-2
VSTQRETQRALLLRVARQAMIEHGLEPDFPAAALAEANQVADSADGHGADVRDLRGLLWCSIDNDDSRDLDQLTVAEALAGDQIKMIVALPTSVPRSRPARTATLGPTPLRSHTASELSHVARAAGTDLTSLVADADQWSPSNR